LEPAGRFRARTTVGLITGEPKRADSNQQGACADGSSQPRPPHALTPSNSALHRALYLEVVERVRVARKVTRN
jgi:hypothetical protein